METRKPKWRQRKNTLASSDIFFREKMHSFHVKYVLPILDVTWRSCFFVPSPQPSYIGGNSTESMSFGRSDEKIFRKLSSALAIDDSLFLFDFDSILFILHCARMIRLRISVYISTCMQYVWYQSYMQYVGFWRCKGSTIFWIIQVRIGLIYLFLVIYMKAFIFRFAV
jgi:hypothetical protein